MFTNLHGSRSVIEFGSSIIPSEDTLSVYPGQSFPGYYTDKGDPTFDLTISYNYDGNPVDGMQIDLFVVGNVDDEGTFTATEEISSYLPDDDLFDLKYNWEEVYSLSLFGELEHVTAEITDDRGSAQLSGLDTHTVYLIVPKRLRLKDGHTMIEGSPKYIVPQWDRYGSSNYYYDSYFWVRENLL